MVTSFELHCIIGSRQKEAEREAEEAAARHAEAEAARQRREAYEGACRIEEQRIQNLVSKKEVCCLKCIREEHSCLSWT